MALEIKYLGIDFGSSSVSVVGYKNAEEKPIIFYDKKSDKFFATAILSNTSNPSDKRAYFQNAYTQPNGIVLNTLKEDIVQNKNMNYIQAYMNMLFKTISECEIENQKYDFSRLEKICLGYPTYINQDNQKAYREHLNAVISKACQQCFGTSTDLKILFAPEPTLAAMAYNEVNKNAPDYKGNVKSGDLILVLDLGGYTLDMAILEAIESAEDRSIRIRQFADPVSIESEDYNIKMGKKITEEICTQIYKDGVVLDANGKKISPPKFDINVENQKKEYFDKKQDTQSQLLKLAFTFNKQQITKFRLLKKHQKISTTETDTVCVGIEESVDGRTINIIQNFQNCADYIKFYIGIHNNKFRNRQISHIIFTGGTSNIEQLRTTIKNHLECNTLVTNNVHIWFVDENKNRKDRQDIQDANYRPQYVNLSSENIVALGAAVYALRGFEEGTSGRGAPSDDLQEQLDRLRTIVYMYLHNDKVCKDCKEILDQMIKII